MDVQDPKQQNDKPENHKTTKRQTKKTSLINFNLK